MALEDLTGSKTIDALNRNNPVGGDQKSFGDDHIRGVKNVILNTFPNVTGAVTLTHTQLNQAAYLPPGSRLIFHDVSAPPGWTQITTGTNDKCIRLTSGAGQGNGGTHSLFSGLSGTQGHTLTLSQIPAHTHTYAIPDNAVTVVGGGGAFAVNGVGNYNTGSSGGGTAHAHNINFSPSYLDCILCEKA